MLIIDDAFVQRELHAGLAISVVRDACLALHRGNVTAPSRAVIELGAGAMFGSMAGAFADDGVYGAKLVSYVPGNAGAGTGGSHHGLVIIFDRATGAPLAAVAAGSLTALRTAAGSALATELLAPQGARVLAIIGSGAQAFSHARLLCHVRGFSRIELWGRTGARAQGLAERIQQAIGVGCRVHASVADAVTDADVVCTTTAATGPVLALDALRAASHVNVIGAARGTGELDFRGITPRILAVDSRDAVLAEAGDVRAARASGALNVSAITELGALVGAEGAPAERGHQAPSVYRSVGHVAFDLACGYALYRCAADQRGHRDRG